MENWKIQDGVNWTEIHPVSDEYREYIIAVIDPANFYCAEKKEKIARLVAAAPKLLAACKVARFNKDRLWIEVRNILDEAIAEAEEVKNDKQNQDNN